MRWLVFLVFAVVISLGGWYAYNNYYKQVGELETNFIPADAWLVLKSDTAENADYLLTQLIQTSTHEAIQNAITESKTKEWMVFISDRSGVGLIVYNSNPLNGTDEFPEVYTTNQFSILSSSPVAALEDHLSDELLVKAKKHSSSFCLMRTGKALESLNGYFTSPTSNILSGLIEDEWVTLMTKEGEQFVQIDGVSKSRVDNSNLPSTTNLFRYLPAQCNSAVILGIDSNSSFLVASIPDETTGSAFTLLGMSHFGNRMQDEADYGGILIGISKIDKVPEVLSIPWEGEAYYADLGNFFIFTESQSQLRMVLDDYLADDVLTRSIYFKKLESAVTDAHFSFYIKPQAGSLENKLVDLNDTEHGINSIIFQRSAEIPFQTFYNLALSRNEMLRDQCPVLWNMYADTEISGGPWMFINHYSGDQEIVIQDKNNQLYLVNGEGKTLWKKQIADKIIDKVEMVDLYNNGKYQLLFTTTTALMAIDRNGNNVPGFPIELKDGGHVSPSVVRYKKKGDVRILVGDGSKILNIDSEGKEVKGWTKPELTDVLQVPINFKSYGSKDYLIAYTSDNKLHLLDRRGKKRQKEQQVDPALMHPTIQIGSTTNSSFVVGYDTVGKIHFHKFSGDTSSKSVLPVGRNVVAEKIEFDPASFAILNEDRLFYRDGNGGVQLDYLLPEVMVPEVSVLSYEKKWVGLNSNDSNSLYVIDLNGKMLDRMPVEGNGSPLLLDVDGNNVLELCVKSDNGELILYQLTN